MSFELWPAALGQTLCAYVIVLLVQVSSKLSSVCNDLQIFTLNLCLQRLLVLFTSESNCEVQASQSSITKSRLSELTFNLVTCYNRLGLVICPFTAE